MAVEVPVDVAGKGREGQGEHKAGPDAMSTALGPMVPSEERG